MKTSAWFIRSLVCLTLLLLASNVRAHYCGPPVIRCKPGDIITYYIISDRAEQGISLFSVQDQSNPAVAPVVFYTPIGRVFGLYVIRALQVGTNQIAAFWSFPPNGASGFCVFEVRVSTNSPPVTAGNFPFSAFYGDPVNMFTGELVVEPSPDLTLGGPMPLELRRYYASRLQADGLVNSRLGNNWSHNFEWRCLNLTNEALVVSPTGLRARFNKSGGNWALQSPTFAPFQLVSSGNNLVFGDPRDQRLYTFNSNGLLNAISDGKGNTHTLSYTNGSYTNNDLLLSVSDGLGRTLTFDYVGAHQLAAVSDGTRRVGYAQIEFLTEFNLLRFTNALGRVTSYTYDNSKIVGSLLTGTTYPQGNAGYTQLYDNDARVIQQTRLGTNVTRYFYNLNNFTTYATNSAGGVSAYLHSPDGQLLSVTDPAGQSLAVTTNSLGLRGKIVDRTGGSYGIAYDAASAKPSAVTNADGTVTWFTYTNHTVSGITFSSLASATLPDGASEQFTYDTVGNLVAHRDRAGRFTRAGYNARGQALSVTNPLGGIVSFAYNADGTPASQGDAESGTVTYQHDALRRPTNAIATDGRSMRLVYDAGDRVVSITDERTNTTFFGYDFNNHLTSVTNPLGQVTQFAYDPADRLSKVTDPLGRAVGYRYGGQDELIALTNRLGNVCQFGWDSRQRLVSQTDPAGKVWSFAYNNEGAAVKVTSPLGHSTGFLRDKAGFISAMTNALGYTTFFGRDALHRLNDTQNPLGRFDQFNYEPRGLLTNTDFSALGVALADYNDLGLLSRIVDHRGGQWRFNYSTLGRLTSLVDPLNRTNSTAHDTRGRPAVFGFADGSRQTNSYDASGNLVKQDFSGGLSLTWSQDRLHRVTNAANLALAYDFEDRVTNTLSAGVGFTAAYDVSGRLTNATYNNGAFSVAYAYDSRDRLTQVRDSLAGAQVNFFYDDSGRLTNVVRANGVNGLYDHDAAGRVTRIREGAFLDLQYSHNAAGDIVALNATTPLTGVPPPQTNTFAFDAAQQISSPGYIYDARGRLTGSPGHVLIWNAAAQLVRVDNITNTFNGAGNLLTRATASGTTRYHYNHAFRGAPVMAEQNAGTTVFQRYYVWTPDGQLLYSIDPAAGNAVSYHHFDLTGSTLALTTGAGAISDAYAYSPYGVLLARTGSNPQPFTYVGRYGVRAETNAGFYQMRARFYDPVTARFVSRDPLWPRPSDPFSINPYNYAANNPLRYIDPSGGRTEAEGVTPVNVLTREDLSRTGAQSVNDILNLTALPQVDPAATINLRGLGNNRTLVLVNGRRLGAGTSTDINSIPTEAVERVEVLKDGASSLYGSDAIAGVVNFILKKPVEEPEPVYDYNQLTVGYKYESTLSISVDYAIKPAAPPPPPAPQPTRASGTLFAFNIVPEFVVVAAYSAHVRATPSSRMQQPTAGEMAQFFLTFGWLPPQLKPRGVAFVNGEIVHSKPMDIIYGAFLKETYYDYLDYRDVSPWEVYGHLFDSVRRGGSGGHLADELGFRAIALPPLL